MKQSIKRKNFLRKWDRYPPMPPARGQFGRLTQLYPDSFYLKGWNQNNTNGASEMGPFPINKVNRDILENLCCGDIIFVDSRNQVYLLAPYLKEIPYSQKILHEWSHLFSDFHFYTQLYFRERKFKQIFSPSLVLCPGSEPTLAPFETELIYSRKKIKMFLPTSPELHLKKAIQMGLGPLFELTKSFRNQELSDHHEPEFWILEWYRPFGKPKEIQQDVLELIEFLKLKMETHLNKSQHIHGVKKVVSTTMRALFQEHFNFEFSPNTSAQQLRNLARSKNIDVHAAESIDDLFFILFFEIESSFDPEILYVVQDFPPYQAALARLTQEGWADRFEIYWRGFEIANAFHELNDPVEQLKRFRKDNLKKKKKNLKTVPVDKEFMDGLFAGMPPTAGIALGLERLFMAMLGVKKIQDLKLFPFIDIFF